MKNKIGGPTVMSVSLARENLKRCRRAESTTIVHPQYRGEHEIAQIPSNYLFDVDILDTSPFFLRSALILIKKHELKYIWKTPTFQPTNRTIDETPMLATMEFGPWFAFSILRMAAAGTNTNPFMQRRIFVTYYCFSREEDLTLFKLVMS